MTSIPAPALNNRPFRAARSQEFGYLRVANSFLLAVVLACLFVLAGLGFVVYRLDQTVRTFKPIVVRINDVGKAEVVYYKDATYQPRSPEIIRALTDFTTDFYTRKQGHVDAYWHSKYMLSQALAQTSWQDDQRTQWTKKVEQGIGVQSDVTVNRVTLVSLTPQGGIAYVDLTRNYFDSGYTSGRSDSETATYYFSFLPKIEGAMLRWNPLGICITDVQLQETFVTK